VKVSTVGAIRWRPLALALVAYALVAHFGTLPAATSGLLFATAPLPVWSVFANFLTFR
jgi:hypothetical protein